MVLTLEHGAYILIALLAVITRLWDLPNRALHHDETLHAVYSWYIYTGSGYIHDPLLHGPFLYYLGAVIYFLFGDNDFTARLGPALFSIVITLLPFLARRELGRTAALVASVYLLISPAFLYVGRFLRHDVYSVCFEMLVFIAILRYASTRKAGWLYAGVAAFTLMYTNQETSYLFLLIMGTPLVLLLLWRVFKPGIVVAGALGLALVLLVFILPGTAVVDGSHTATRDPATGQMQVDTAGPLFGWGPLETEDNVYALRIRNRPDNQNGSLLNSIGTYMADLGLFFRHPAILLSVGLLLGSVALLIWLIGLRRNSEGITAWQQALERGDTVVSVYASLLEGRRWLAALVIFFVIYALFFTAFFTNIIGVISGTTGSLLYWLAQHNVERGGQPGYYYLLILIIYEPLMLFWAGVGVLLTAYRVIQPWRTPVPADAATDQPGARSPAAYLLPLLLVWWTISALGIYSWAGEKMPWLTVHVALPMVLLGAWAFQQVVRRGFSQVRDSSSSLPLAIFGGAFILIAGVGYIRMSIYAHAADRMAMLGVLIPAVVLLLIVLLGIVAGLMQGWRWSLGALAVWMAVVGGAYTVRNAYRVTYVLADVPREMLIYTQTSPDVMYVVRRLEEISRLRTSGLDMPIIYDNETVWLWYLRNFTNATNNHGTLSGPPDENVQAVLMLYENVARSPEIRDYLSEFRVQRYPLRWWFPEGEMYQKGPDWRTIDLEYASLLTRAMRAPFDDETLVQLWDFFMYRDIKTPLGSTDFILAVRPAIADQVAPGIGSD